MTCSYALDSETREEKMMHYLPLVKYLAGRIPISRTSQVDIDDLIGYGVIGLIDAIDRFDPKKGVKFETYASFRIKGAIIDELRKLNWIPRSAMVKVSKLNEVRDELKACLGREPQDDEIASKLGVSIDELRKTENYINYLSVVSLDEVIFQSDEDELLMNAAVEDTKSPRPDAVLEEKEKLSILKKAIELVNEKDRLVLSLYYYEKLTLKEIGRILDVSESRVSQIHSRALMRLRENIRKLNYI